MHLVTGMQSQFCRVFSKEMLYVEKYWSATYAFGKLTWQWKIDNFQDVYWKWWLSIATLYSLLERENILHMGCELLMNGLLLQPGLNSFCQAFRWWHTIGKKAKGAYAVGRLPAPEEITWCNKLITRVGVDLLNLTCLWFKGRFVVCCWLLKST